MDTEEQKQIMRDLEQQSYGLADGLAMLNPTPEAIVRQIESTLEKISRAYRYGKYAGELIARGTGGREIALCITKLQEAKQWAQEALSEIGELPYHPDNAPNSACSAH